VLIVDFSCLTFSPGLNCCRGKINTHVSSDIAIKTPLLAPVPNVDQIELTRIEKCLSYTGLPRAAIFQV
jgi:hypothetical protein